MFHENRRYDHIYDPVYIAAKGRRTLYRADKTVTTAKIRGIERSKFFAQSNKQFAQTTNVFLDADYLKSPTSAHLPSPSTTTTGHPSSGLNLSTSMDLYQKNLKSRSHSMQKSRSRDSLNAFAHSRADQFTKTIGIQTDFRDSSIQTDPYSPDFEIIKDVDGDDNAPLLQTMHLKYSNGSLPAGYDEIEALEREVIKKQIISALPKGNDKKSLKIRRKILSSIEASDWEYKETLMKREQHERYLHVISEMKKRDQMIEKLEEERINKLRMDLYAKQQKFDSKIEKQRIKALRKINNKHNKIQNVMNNISHSSFNGNIGKMIDRYYNYDSELYAPIKYKGSMNRAMSTGMLLKTINNSASMGVDNEIHKLSLTQAIERLDIGIQNDMNAFKNAIPTNTNHNNNNHNIDIHNQISDSIKLETKKYATRTGQKIMAQLNHINDLMKATYDENIDNDQSGIINTNQVSKRFENIYKTFNPIARPPTPTLDTNIFDINKQNDNDNIILLQSLVRGRAIQNQMYQGKEQRLKLIQELQIEQKNEFKATSHTQFSDDKQKLFNDIAPFVMDAIKDALS